MLRAPSFLSPGVREEALRTWRGILLALSGRIQIEKRGDLRKTFNQWPKGEEEVIRMAKVDIQIFAIWPYWLPWVLFSVDLLWIT